MYVQYDGISSDLRIRWSKSSVFGPKYHDSTHRIIKSKNGIGLQASKNLTEHGRPGTAAVRGTPEARVAIDALDYEYNHDAGRSRRASPQLDYS